MAEIADLASLILPSEAMIKF